MFTSGFSLDGIVVTPVGALGNCAAASGMSTAKAGQVQSSRVMAQFVQMAFGFLSELDDLMVSNGKTN